MLSIGVTHHLGHMGRVVPNFVGSIHAYANHVDDIKPARGFTKTGDGATCAMRLSQPQNNTDCRNRSQRLQKLTLPADRLTEIELDNRLVNILTPKPTNLLKQHHAVSPSSSTSTKSIPKPHASKPHASTCVTWCSSEWSEPHLTHMALQPLLDCNYTLPSFRFKSRIMTSLYSVWNCWLLVRWSSERVHT